MECADCRSDPTDQSHLIIWPLSRPGDKQQQSHDKLLTSDTVWAPWGSGWTRGEGVGEESGRGEKSEK